MSEWIVPVDQAEVLLANGDAFRADAHGQALPICVAGPVPLHAVMLQRGDQLQGLILHGALAQPLQSLVSGHDAAEKDEHLCLVPPSKLII